MASQGQVHGNKERGKLLEREKGRWEGYRKQSIGGIETSRYSGFSLAELLPGKERRSFFLLGLAVSQGMRAPCSGLLTILTEISNQDNK